MFLILLPTLLCAVVGAFYFFFKKRFQYWEERGFDYERPSIPWGNSKGIATQRSIGEVVNDVYKAGVGKKIVGMFMFHKPALVIRDPELIKIICVRDFSNFHDRGIYVNEKDDPLSAHLFSIAGAKWRNLRVKLTPTFTSGKMKMMFPILVECSRQFKNILDGPAEREEVIEVKDYSARFTTDIISLAAFGIETDSLHNPDSEFRLFGQKIFDPNLFEAIKGLVQGMMPWLATLFRITTNRKDVSEFFLKVFKESMDYRETNKIRRNDFMDLLIQLKQKGKLEDVDNDTGDGTKFTFEEAAAQAFVFFVAGFETSSTTMQFALYELAKNPEIQQKAREEVQQVLAKFKGEVSYESVAELDYLSRVIDETLRKYPPVPFLQRECNKDYKIPGTDLVIPKNIGVLIDATGLHNDPTHFPDPEKFDPERFTEKEKSKRHNYSYLPFGEGPRNCIGMRFGLMQTKVGMLTLLSNFEFSVAKNTPIPLVLDTKSFITSPKGGMPIKISKLKI